MLFWWHTYAADSATTGPLTVYTGGQHVGRPTYVGSLLTRAVHLHGQPSYTGRPPLPGPASIELGCSLPCSKVWGTTSLLCCNKCLWVFNPLAHLKGAHSENTVFYQTLCDWGLVLNARFRGRCSP